MKIKETVSPRFMGFEGVLLFYSEAAKHVDQPNFSLASESHIQYLISSLKVVT